MKAAVFPMSEENSSGTLPEFVLSHYGLVCGCLHWPSALWQVDHFSATSTEWQSSETLQHFLVYLERDFL